MKTFTSIVIVIALVFIIVPPLVDWAKTTEYYIPVMGIWYVSCAVFGYNFKRINRWIWSGNV